MKSAATRFFPATQSASVGRNPFDERRAVMAKAVWNGKVIAESDTFETVEGNVYFPEGALVREYFRPSTTTSSCPWKGQARYYSLVIDGQENPGRRLVLSRSQARRPQYQEPRCVLARRRSRKVTLLSLAHRKFWGTRCKCGRSATWVIAAIHLSVPAAKLE